MNWSPRVSGRFERGSAEMRGLLSRLLGGGIMLAGGIVLCPWATVAAEAAVTPAIELVTLDVRQGEGALVSASVDSDGVCALVAKKGRVTTRSIVAVRSGVVEWRWRVGARAPRGAWNVSVRCATSRALLGLRGVSSRKVPVAVVRRPVARRGSRLLVAPNTVRVSLRRTVSGAKVGGPSQGVVVGGVGADANPFWSTECTYEAFAHRPDIYVSAVAAGVPAGGVATSRVFNQVGIGSVPDYWWNAWRWADNARRVGIPVGTNPVAGSVVVFPQGWGNSAVGHVGYVVSVNTDGTFNTIERGVSPGREVPRPFRRSTGPGIQFIYGGPAGTGGSAPGGPSQPGVYDGFMGDFNRDAAVDTGLRNSLSGLFFARFGPTFANQVTFQWDNSISYQSFMGDFNGDGNVDVGLRNPVSGLFFARFGPTFANQVTFQWDKG